MTPALYRRATDRLKTDIACPPVQTVKDQPVQYPNRFLFQANYSSSEETRGGWGGGTGAYVELDGASSPRYERHALWFICYTIFLAIVSVCVCPVLFIHIKAFWCRNNLSLLLIRTSRVYIYIHHENVNVDLVRSWKDVWSDPLLPSEAHKRNFLGAKTNSLLVGSVHTFKSNMPKGHNPGGFSLLPGWTCFKGDKISLAGLWPLRTCLDRPGLSAGGQYAHPWLALSTTLLTLVRCLITEYQIASWAHL